LFAKSPGVVNALLAIRSGENPKAALARQWLSATSGLTSTERKSIGVNYLIRSPEDAINALTTLTRLTTYGTNNSTKLVLMLDEFQKIGEIRGAVANEIKSALHTLFNENPKSLALFLAFSSGRQENVYYLLSPELRSRTDPETISLDSLDPT